MSMFFITKKKLVVLIGIIVAAWILSVALMGCIPVTVRPQFDDQGKPIALPVTPTGSVSPDGTITPIYEISNQAPKPFNTAAVVAGISGFLNLLLAVYGINLRGVVSQAKTALGIACNLADGNAQAETDEEVERNKRAAFAAQVKANVHTLTQSVRGKT